MELDVLTAPLAVPPSPPSGLLSPTGISLEASSPVPLLPLVDVGLNDDLLEVEITYRADHLLSSNGLDTTSPLDSLVDKGLRDQARPVFLLKIVLSRRPFRPLVHHRPPATPTPKRGTRPNNFVKPTTMPGLTLNTGAAAAAMAAANQQAPAAATTTNNNASSSITQSTTPIPVPVPMSIPTPAPYASHQQQDQPSSRSSSPVRPTYSPITPPLNPTALPPRPTYTHSSHTNATAAAAPPPEPIDFDSNPDVLALKSAISILQMQRRKAERDMATLARVKSAALAEPEAFVRDLTAGRVRVEGEGLFIGGDGVARDEDSDSGSDDSNNSSSDNDTTTTNNNNNIKSNNDDDEMRGVKSGDNPADNKQPQTHQHAARETAAAAAETKPNIKADPDVNKAVGGGGEPRLWAAIPKPQNIVRCPPINWSQYAVVGESLDRLHNEQVMRPAQGTPAVVTPEGRIEFSGGGGGGAGKQERYVGVAAPYVPGKDRIERKPKKAPPR
ncbi:hypothetical protein F5Y19DRAFT_493003 [Xylariaceae sp. FL1651]|nr:hypothetical protein F5Y19DRAFT_493003 [Xylariaceae sp. FL1651]